MDSVVVEFEKVEVRAGEHRLSSEWSVDISQDILTIDGTQWSAHDVLNNMILDLTDETVCSEPINDD